MGQETEAKFYLKDLLKMETRLQNLGAQLIQPRTHEINLRFDTPNKDFLRGRRVLRLRQDEAAHLTYKDGTRLEDGAFSRREIEFIVSDFDAARQFIEALGYEAVFTYEKFRTTYALPSQGSKPFGDKEDLNMHLMLDELPYGGFIEIEGIMDRLKPIAIQIGLNWEAAIPASYHELFDRVCSTRKLSFRDLTYKNFNDIHVLPEDLHVIPADE